MLLGKADAMALPFASGTFDVVMMNAVLYFVPDREKAMKEVHRVL